jgi:hypothetical protein
MSGPHSRPTIPQKNLVALGIEPGTSGSVAKSCDHWTTVAVSLHHSTDKNRLVRYVTNETARAGRHIG